MLLNLSSNKWSIIGTWPLEWMRFEKEMDTEKLVGIAVTPWVDSNVPGSVHKDLLNSGLIQDPYYDLNSLNCEWVHNRAWIYRTKFKIPGNFNDKRLALVFNGVDYFSYYYLNGFFLGKHEGMFTKVFFNVDEHIYRDKCNTLFVVVEKAPEEVAQMGETRNSRFQKSRFGYKWDFGTKLVNIGIWKDVYLKGTYNVNIEDIYVRYELLDINKVKLTIQVKIKCCISQRIKIDYSIKEENDILTEVANNTLNVDCKKGINTFNIIEYIENPKIWWPNGYGQQNLYNIKVKALDDEKISDENSIRFGIKNVRFIRNEKSPLESLPYTIIVNGHKIFIKGWNWVPLDHMYGSVKQEKYEWFIKLAKNANVNLLRVWGGGLIEKDIFYELCDRYGIMVWQEFIQCSSSISNETNKNEEYLKLLFETSMEAIIRKRNHVSLVAWCGGNELISDDFIPQDFNDKNLKMLKKLVDEYDPGRMFFPTSPSGPAVHYKKENTGKNMHHDIHGMWNYEGMEEHYKKYNMMDCLLHSEFGAEGCSRKDVVESIVNKKNYLPANKNNMFWNHKGAAWWDVDERDEVIFGERDTLEVIVKCSQFIQAEALRYIIESNRRRKFYCSGCIPWQMNEPWPNITCTNAVDYYGNPKMAYYWIRNSYEHIHASLKYEKLIYEKGEKFLGHLYINNSSVKSEKVVIEYEIMDICGNLIKYDKFDKIIPRDKSIYLDDIIWNVEEMSKGIFFVRLIVKNSENNKTENVYIFSQKRERPFENLTCIENTELVAEYLSEEDDKLSVTIRNNGREAALFVNIYLKNIQKSIICNENFSTIFPGEQKIFNIEDIKEHLCRHQNISLMIDCLNLKMGKLITQNNSRLR